MSILFIFFLHRYINYIEMIWSVRKDITFWIKQIKRQIWILENSKKAENVYAK